MRSNATVGPPIDLAMYCTDELDLTRLLRLMDKDPELLEIRKQWEQALRKSVLELPTIKFEA